MSGYTGYTGYTGDYDYEKYGHGKHGKYGHGKHYDGGYAEVAQVCIGLCSARTRWAVFVQL
jgi:hypothetical protein